MSDSNCTDVASPDVPVAGRLSLEVIIRVFRFVDRRSLARSMRVCKWWRTLVKPILLRRVDFNVFVALTDSYYIIHDHLQFNHIPFPGEWDFFLQRIGSNVRVFEDNIYSPGSLEIGTLVFTGLFQCPQYIFPNLRVLRVDIAYLRPPLLSPLIEKLSVCIARPLMGGSYPFHHHSIVGGSAALRTAPSLLPRLRHLRIDGDDTAEEFADDLALFCQSMATLVTVELTPYAVSEPLFVALARLPHLVSIRILECGKDGNADPDRGPLLGPLAAPVLPPGSFPALEHASLTSWSPALTTSFVIQTHFPSSTLRTLWVKYSTSCPISPIEVRTLLRAIAWTFPVLEELTLRFAAYGYHADRYAASDRLAFCHIRSFLAIFRLTSFTLDHTFPLLMTEADLEEMAGECSRFRCLLLNPYPTVPWNDEMGPLPPLSILGLFSEFCPLLETFGIMVSACNHISPSAVVRFSRLREFFVGWSTIPLTVREGDCLCRWEDIAVYLSVVMDDVTELRTVYGHGRPEDPEDMVCAPMRARCHLYTEYDPYYQRMSLSWSSVWMMASFHRKYRRYIESL